MRDSEFAGRLDFNQHIRDSECCDDPHPKLDRFNSHASDLPTQRSDPNQL